MRTVPPALPLAAFVGALGFASLGLGLAIRSGLARRRGDAELAAQVAATRTLMTTIAAEDRLRRLEDRVSDQGAGR